MRSRDSPTAVAPLRIERVHPTVVHPLEVPQYVLYVHLQSTHGTLELTNRQDIAPPDVALQLINDSASSMAITSAAWQRMLNCCNNPSPAQHDLADLGKDAKRRILN